MAKQVVQVSADAFPLGDHGQPLDFALRQVEPRVAHRPFHFKYRDGADDRDEDERWREGPYAIREQRHVRYEEKAKGHCHQDGDAEYGDARPAEVTEARGRVDQEGRGTGIEAEDQADGADGRHAHRREQARSADLVEAPEVQREEAGDARCGSGPIPGRRVRVEERRSDREHEEAKVDPRPPAVALETIGERVHGWRE